MVKRKFHLPSLIFVTLICTTSQVEGMKKRYPEESTPKAAIVIPVCPGITVTSTPRRTKVNDENVEDPFNEGLAYYDEGNYNDALPCFLNARSNNHPEAQEKIADVLNKIGIQHIKEGELDEAGIFFNHSAISGNTSGFYNLGVLHYNAGDLDMALEFFEKAFQYNHKKAQNKLAIVQFKKALRCQRSSMTDKALELLRKAKENGHKLAQKTMGEILYQLGDKYSDEHDLPLAIRYYTQASECGDSNAPYKLGILSNIEESSEGRSNALKWFEIARMRGNPLARYGISDIEKIMASEQEN